MVNCIGITRFPGERGMNMICKYCLAELEEGVTVCPLCGKDLSAEEMVDDIVEENVVETSTEETVEEIATEETSDETAEEPEEVPAEAPAKKKSGAGKVVLAVVGVVVLAVVLAGAIIFAIGMGDAAMAKLNPILHKMKFWRENDVFYHLSYSGDAAEIEATEDTVVAQIGDQKLTLAELQAFYGFCVYDALNYNQFPELDTKTPMDQQIYDEETGKTYQQMFLENALESWRRYAILVQMAKDANFTLTAEQQSEVAAFEQNLKDAATQYKYDDVEKFIDAQLLEACSAKGYIAYNTTLYHALSYYETLYDQLMPTQEQVEAYYAANEGKFVENKIDKNAGYYYDVRHILIAAEGGAASGTYTDEDWENWRASAQFILDDFLADEPTEEKFAALAKEQSVDTGSKENGGLYNLLTKDTNFVQEFKDWYLDESRQPGDTGLVKTVHGYHIMYFSGKTPIWEYEAKTMALADATTKILEEAEAQYPLTVNYKAILLGEFKFAF